MSLRSLSCFLCFFLILSCSSKRLRNKKNTEVPSKVRSRTQTLGKRNFQLSDLSGSYRLSRDLDVVGGKYYFENKLYNRGMTNQVLERSQIVLRVKKVKNRVILFPEISQFTTWIEKKKFFSEIKTNLKEKKYIISTEPEGQRMLNAFADTDWVCPFSVLSDCIQISGFVEEASKGSWIEKDLWILWDIFPYQQKFYENVRPGMLEKIKLVYEGKKDSYLRFTAEVSNQSISLLYTPRFVFEKMIWVAQGLSLTLQ